jgi:hypothetical protein
MPQLTVHIFSADLDTAPMLRNPIVRLTSTDLGQNIAVYKPGREKQDEPVANQCDRALEWVSASGRNRTGAT